MEHVQEFGPLETLIQVAPMDFQIMGGGENYIGLNNTKLEVRAKLTMPDGTDISDVIVVSVCGESSIGFDSRVGDHQHCR